MMYRVFPKIGPPQTKASGATIRFQFPNRGPGATIWSKCEIAKIPKPNTGPGAYFRKNPVPTNAETVSKIEIGHNVIGVGHKNISPIEQQ